MKNLISVVLLIVLLAFIVLGGIVWGDSNGVWHRPEDIQGGTFGLDEVSNTNNYTFIHPVNFDDELNANAGIKTNIIRSSDGSGNVVIQLG